MFTWAVGGGRWAKGHVGKRAGPRKVKCAREVKVSAGASIVNSRQMSTTHKFGTDITIFSQRLRRR